MAREAKICTCRQSGPKLKRGHMPKPVTLYVINVTVKINKLFLLVIFSMFLLWILLLFCFCIVFFQLAVLDSSNEALVNNKIVLKYRYYKEEILETIVSLLNKSRVDIPETDTGSQNVSNSIHSN